MVPKCQILSLPYFHCFFLSPPPPSNHIIHPHAMEEKKKGQRRGSKPFSALSLLHAEPWVIPHPHPPTNSPQPLISAWGLLRTMMHSSESQNLIKDLLGRVGDSKSKSFLSFVHFQHRRSTGHSALHIPPTPPIALLL